MAAINTLLKEINLRLRKGESLEAFNLYTEILNDNREYWKKVPIKKLTELADSDNFKYMYSQNISDMFVLDTRKKQLIMVWLVETTIFLEHDKNLFKWIERTRQSLEDEYLKDYGYHVNVLFICNTSDEDFFEDKKLENKNFFYTNTNNIDFNVVGSQKNENNIIEEVDYGSMLEFSFDMAYGLADMEPEKAKENPPEEEPETEEPKNKIPKSKFNVLDIAPLSLLEFLENNSKALENMELKEMFKLSLSSVIVSDNPAKNYDLISLIRHSLKAKNDSITFRLYDILDTDNLDKLKGFVGEQTSSIAIIENLEAPLNPYLNFKKSDIVRTLCKELDSNDEALFVLTASKKGWTQLVAEFPQLRVYFQNVFIIDEIKVQTLFNHLIAEFERYSLQLNDEAQKLILEFYNYIKQSQNPQLFDFPMSLMLAKEIRYYHAVRISKEKPEDKNTICLEDVQLAIKDEYVLDVEYNLNEVLSKIDYLTGLSNVKKQIRDIAALVKISSLRNSSMPNSSNPISLNSVFLGNPGTGKTTVARYLGEVFKSIGALQKGHVVAVSRQDIVKRYIGHTEENFTSIINKARGGILLIDEAYSLHNDDTKNDFGRDAINVLVDRLDDIRQHTCVILSGYPDEMKQFLSSNPGLESRFPTTIHFKDYELEELKEIFINMIQKENFRIEVGAEFEINQIFEKLIKEKDRNFGNARTCRNLFERIKLIQARRITYANESVSEDLNLLSVNDFLALKNEAEQTKVNDSRKKLGFRISSLR